MEFLKDVFGNEALTYEQLAEKLKDNEKIKLGNLAEGQYISREKFDAMKSDRDGLKAQLTDANAKIQEFQGMDIDGIQQAVEDWKTKYDSDTQKLKDELAAQNYAFTVKEALAGMKFSSESARRAFTAGLKEKGLPVQDGKLLGLDDFVKTYKETDPAAFAPDRPAPQIVLGGGRKPPLAGVTREQYKQMGYTDRLRLKTEQPQLYSELAADS